MIAVMCPKQGLESCKKTCSSRLRMFVSDSAILNEEWVLPTCAKRARGKKVLLLIQERECRWSARKTSTPAANQRRSDGKCQRIELIRNGDAS